MPRPFVADDRDLCRSTATICATKWGKDERHVTKAMKDQVFAFCQYSGYDDAHCELDAHGKTCEMI
jgi:hypothetical protein